jgi:hypothetical protein
MESVKTHKTTTPVLICPECGFEHFGISKTSGWLCYQCGYDFGDVENMDWTDVQVDAVNCNVCGEEVLCTKREVSCPNCYGRIIGIKYRGKWRPPKAFLQLKGRDGYLPVRTKREKLALYVLNRKAKREERSFRTINPEDSKVLWKDGRAIGYHTVNEYDGLPCGRQIYVIPEERRRGYGTLMFIDFLDDHKKVAVESPNNKMLRLLEKLELVEIDSEGIAHSLGRVTFVQ